MNASLLSIEKQVQQYYQILAQYEATSLYKNCTQLIRVIDEQLPIPDALDCFFSDYSYLSLDPADERNHPTLNEMRQQISEKISPEVSERFYTFALMCASIPENFLTDRIYSAGTEPYAMGDVMRYLSEKITKHLKNILLLIPHVCKGEKRFEYTETLQHLLPPIENYLLNLNLSAVYFTLIKNAAGITTSNDKNDYTSLEFSFVNPIYMASSDQLQFGVRGDHEVTFLPMPAGRLHAYLQIENSQRWFLKFWKKYAVTTSIIYQELQTMIQDLKDYCTDDYFIRVPVPAFEKIISNLPKINQFLILQKNDYSTVNDSFAPFVIIDGYAKSSVKSLLTFVDMMQFKLLSRNRQFQVDTKAKFESEVTELITEHGFVKNSLQSVSNSESTLTATKDNITYTFYLKSNPVDIIKLNIDFKHIIRLNQQRINYYQKQLTSSTCIVISRTPILTTIPGIINYTSLYEFLQNIIR